MTTREQAFRAAAGEVVEGLARQDARSPRDAAVASLGPDATEVQIAAWIREYRPSDVLRQQFDARYELDEGSGCWVWHGRVGTNRYGYVRDNGRERLAHRVAYELLVGPIPSGLTIDHLCRNTRCVNPEHLEPVTAAENRRRADAARTTCPQGHPWDEANTKYVQGNRQCRACNRDYMRRKAAERRARSDAHAQPA